MNITNNDKARKYVYLRTLSLLNTKNILLYLKVLQVHSTKSDSQKDSKIIVLTASIHRFLESIQEEISPYLTDIDGSHHLEFPVQYSTARKTQANHGVDFILLKIIEVFKIYPKKFDTTYWKILIMLIVLFTAVIPLLSHQS
jgi:hypothetical protein